MGLDALAPGYMHMGRATKPFRARAAVSGIKEGVWMRRVRVCERGFAPAAEADPV